MAAASGARIISRIYVAAYGTRENPPEIVPAPSNMVAGPLLLDRENSTAHGRLFHTLHPHLFQIVRRPNGQKPAPVYQIWTSPTLFVLIKARFLQNLHLLDKWLEARGAIPVAPNFGAKSPRIAWFP
jgi:hypothetical protein